MARRRRLTNKQINEIYLHAWRGDESQYIIAVRFGITQGTVSAIKHGHMYAEVTGHRPWQEAKDE